MNFRRIILIGGAKGVGKSTLLNGTDNTNDFTIVNTGDLKLYSDSKNLIFSDVLESFVYGHNNLVLDTHYAVYQGRDFRRNRLYEYLPPLIQGSDISLALIDLDLKILLERRRKDLEKSRNIDLDHMNKELEYNRKYFKHFCHLFDVKGHVFTNDDLETCSKNLRRLLMYGN
ncbi:MAG: hypothetical protein ACOCUU_01645 [Nanoarchaeota archaeon]